MEHSDAVERIIYLVHLLNTYRDAYYNDAHPIVNDEEYDSLFDELNKLENEFGFIMSNSPTQTVGYEVKSTLDKVTHQYPPLLSLDKTKDILNIFEFIGGKPALVMAKLDGLTCRLTYKNGKLIQAASRGNGIIGEDITHNIKFIKDVPLTLPIKEDMIVDGEIIVRRDIFQKLKAKFLDEKGKEYKNARNFAAGSARLHDNEECKERRLQFIAWKAVKGVNDVYHFSSQLKILETLGFNIVPFTEIPSDTGSLQFEIYVKMLKEWCETLNYPIDGTVFSFNKIEYLNTFEYTSHHWKAQKAFKFEDDNYDTVIREIDWTMGKTGIITPTAIFDTVEIDGTEISRANLHNLTIMKNLNVTKNCSAKVYKANMIIPQILSTSDDGDGEFEIPANCPVCGSPTVKIQENDSEVLACLDPHCMGTLLGKLTSFVSKNGMDIEGLSEGKLLTLLEKGFIQDYVSIYELLTHESELLMLPGWGEVSVMNLINAIEKSRKTSLDHFITALNIPNIGPASAKALARECNYDYDDFVAKLDLGYNWANIEGFGSKTSDSINKWYYFNESIVKLFRSHLFFNKPVSPRVIDKNSKVAGKTFCITGRFEYPRSEIQREIENAGGIFVPSVSKKTDILFVGDDAGSKLKKAQDLGITIVEEEFFRLWL